MLSNTKNKSTLFESMYHNKLPLFFRFDHFLDAKGRSHTTYTYKILYFFDLDIFYGTYECSQRHFKTTYLPRLENIVCERSPKAEI